MQRGDILHHVRRLGTLVDRQPRLGGVPVGDDRARLQRHTGVPSEDEISFHHGIGAGERGIDLTGVEVALESQVIAERGMNHRGCRIKRGAHVRHRLQRLVVDLNDFRGVFRHRAAGRHNGGTASPCQQTRSIAMACWAADLRPFRCDSTPTHGVITAASSLPVTTAMTPGMSLAAATSMPAILACAWGERRNTTCPMRGSSISLT
jgi:hypothetical protein